MIAPAVHARAVSRWRLALPLLVPALGGLAYLAAFGAPARLIAVNAAALAAGALWAAWGRLPSRTEARLGLAAAAAGVLFVPLLTGPVAGGVARWLPAGPVMLHSGALLLPLVVVLAARAGERAGAAVLALAAAALALQPDAGALTGLAAASAALAAARSSIALAAVAAGASVLAGLTFGAGTLEPQLYTEGVLAQVWQSAPAAALALAALLFLAAPALLVLLPGAARREGAALAALLVGFGVMAVIAPFPFPLIGYGAAPILGLGLALGAIGTVSKPVA